MDEREKECTRECTCQKTFGHYLTVLGSMLRIASVVVGIVFATETDSKVKEVKLTIDKAVEFIESFNKD